MNDLKALVIRNIKNFLRDKAAVFFSFLSIIILVALYFMFIGNNFRPNELAGLLTNQQLDFMVYSQLIPGLIVINTASIPIGNLGNIINDFEYGQVNSLLVTPVKRYKITLGYYISSFVITFVLSLMLIIFAFLIIGITTFKFYSFDIWINTILLTLLFSFISTAVMVFITSFIKSVNAFGVFSGVFGTLIGFISGIYMPLFILPDIMQKISGLVPWTHMNVSLKQVILKPAFEMLETELIDKIPIEDYNNLITELRIAYGVENIGIFGIEISHIWIFLIMTIISIGLLSAASKMLTRRLKK